MKLSYKRTILVGLAFMTISAFWQLYDFVIPLILKHNFKIESDAIGIVMSLDNVLALFLLPLFGALSDRTHTRFGRRMPYIVLGTCGAVVCMLMLPVAANNNWFVVFVAALALVLLSMAVYRSPAVALMPDVTPKPLRSKGNAVINLMGSVGGILILGAIQFLAPKEKGGDYSPLFLFLATIMVAGVAALVLKVREPAWSKKMREDSAAAGIDPEDAKQDASSREKAKKLPKDVTRSLVLILCSISLWFLGYNAVTTWFSTYATDAHQLQMTEAAAANVLMVANIAAIIAFIPVGLISSKIGRKKSILIGVTMLAIVFGTAVLYRQPSPLMYVSFSFAGIAWALINVNSLPMVLEMSSGGNIGKYTGFYYTFSMAAQVITPILSGFLFKHISLKYGLLFPYATVFICIAFVTMLFVRHGDSKPVPPKSKLEVLGAD